MSDLFLRTIIPSIVMFAAGYYCGWKRCEAFAAKAIQEVAQALRRGE